MNKKELVAQIAEQTGLTQKKVNEVLDTFFDLTGTALKNGDSIRLLGFGTFETKKRAARTGTNPRTGEQVDIPASVIPVFKAGKKLKEKVNNK